MPELETLTCSAGHTWQRVSKRGKKPKSCPEHSKVKPKTQGLSPEEKTRRQQEGRLAKQQEKDVALVAEVLAYREWVKLDAKTWSEYASGEIDHAEYKRRKPPLPKIPDNAAYDAARRAGVIAPDVTDE